MNQKNWKQRFTDEFGIHFSGSELQFALAFIEEEIDEAYKRGQLAEIEANATADITIAQEQVEQIRRQERDRIWHEHLGLGKDIREVLSNQ
jgi:hypothetical protein